MNSASCHKRALGESPPQVLYYGSLEPGDTSIRGDRAEEVEWHESAL